MKQVDRKFTTITEDAMLCLTRKPGEKIVITGPATITVLSVGTGRTKLGIEAAPEVTVDREEVAKRKEEERRDAA